MVIFKIIFVIFLFHVKNTNSTSSHFEIVQEKKGTTDTTQSKESEGKNVPDAGEYDFLDTSSDQQKSVSFIEEISDLMKETFDLMLHSLFII